MTLEPSEVIRGQAPGPVTFWVFGGRVGNIVSDVVHDPRYSLGDSCFVFLTADTRGELWGGHSAYFFRSGKAFGRGRQDLGLGASDLLDEVRELAQHSQLDSLALSAPFIVQASVARVDTLLDGFAFRIRTRPGAVHRGVVRDTSLMVVQSSPWHAPSFDQGEQALLLLELTEAGDYRIVGGWLGKYRRLQDGRYRRGPKWAYAPGLADGLEFRPDRLNAEALVEKDALAAVEAADQ